MFRHRVRKNLSTHSARLLERCKRSRFTVFVRKAHRSYSTFKYPNQESGSNGEKPPLRERLAAAWKETPTTWYPLPAAVGALLLLAIQFRRKLAGKEVEVDAEGREVVKLKGPWHIHVMGALPLRNLSRLWGYMNSLELPMWFRPYGFRFYAWIFNCNLGEIEPADLTQYASLGEFFYRSLKDGARPIADAILVSPADGTVLHFGTITDGRVEQVKGSTYSLDALLGVESPHVRPAPVAFPHRHMAEVHDRDFADINGIEYSLQELLGSSIPASGAATPIEELPPFHTRAPHATKFGKRTDASVPPDASLPDVVAHDASVAAEMGLRSSLERTASRLSKAPRPGNGLYFAVIYLAPGDYHRFHSPTAWVVEKRRHFVGDLFSVSPWMARRLHNLFVLNERVALLGRWRYGFFSMIPVGATNVGSIKIDFDQALRTNVTSNVASRYRPPIGTYTEAVYSAASPVLHGQPLLKAQQMGGFCLGSTIVLVFEAPLDFEFTISASQKIKVGERMGDVAAALESKKER